MLKGKRELLLFILIGSKLASGCGTTRYSDTQRTATEQLLISHAVDQAVSHVDFSALAGKKVFFDDQYVEKTPDKGYLVSSIRQQLLASGCHLQEDRAKASYIVEARCGSMGTDRHDLLVGVPQMSMPSLLPVQPTLIPEIPLVKKTNQKGVAKIAVFAYNRMTGQPVFQSGTVQEASNTRSFWVFGAGPFQQGTFLKETEYAAQPIAVPFFSPEEDEAKPSSSLVPVTEQATWIEPAARK